MLKPVFYNLIFFADINRRFVDKTPLHKALKARFQQAHGAARSAGRANKAQPLFVLNLSCPRALYEASFEPSKSTVEFKVGR